MNGISPVCLFTYNRLTETKQTVEALQRNFLALESDLIIFSDGSNNENNLTKIQAVRQYIHTISGFKSVTIFESPDNKGLANSIISGVTQIIEKYGKVIVMEDDLISTPNFLEFMNRGLEFYKNDQNIQSINGYSLSIDQNEKNIYFQMRPFPWGWATWADRWNLELFDKMKIKKVIDSDRSVLKQFKKNCGHDISKMLLNSINNKNDSWYVRWTFNHFLNNKYSVFPKYCYIQNIGQNNKGTHCKGIGAYQSVLANEEKEIPKFDSFELPDKIIMRFFLKYFTFHHKIMIRIKLLPTKAGRKILFEDIKIKMGIYD